MSVNALEEIKKSLRAEIAKLQAALRALEGDSVSSSAGAVDVGILRNPASDVKVGDIVGTDTDGRPLIASRQRVQSEAVKKVIGDAARARHLRNRLERERLAKAAGSEGAPSA